MSNTVAASTLYFEGNCSDAADKTHGYSGETVRFQYFTGSSSDIHHLTVAARLPALQGDALVGYARIITLNVTLPALTGVAYLGGYGAGTLPALRGSGSITNNVHLSCNVLLPALQGSSHTLAGYIVTVKATLPQLTVSARRGWAFPTMSLPSLQGSGVGHLNLHLSGSPRLPALQGSATYHRTSNNLSCNVILPALQGISRTVDTSIVLPALRGSASITNGTVVVSQAWVMNVENFAITKFQNFSFRNIVRAFDKYWAVGMAGNLYRLGGDTDVGSPIAWEWRTGLSDLGSRALKGVMAVYADGVIEKGCTYTLITDHDVYVYDHRPRGSGNDHKPQRVPFGRGVRTVNVGLGMASTLGAYMQVDALTPEYVQTERNM